jgi:hypothetical protein
MNSKELGAAVESTLEHLSKVCPGNREDLLQVLAHITFGALKGKDPAHVTSYFLKITKMLDGKFDR